MAATWTSSTPVIRMSPGTFFPSRRRVFIRDKADERKSYFKQTLETLRGTDAARVFENYVRVDSAVEWSQDNSKPVVAYKKYSRSAIEYKKLAKEITEYADR